MPTGLVALLDDISVIARAAAASVDDISMAAGKAGTKAAGVVIDDAAVTPGYVTGLSPARELPIIWKITRGSLKNKLLLLLPAALLLSEFLPWAIMPLLMLGGAFLCYEGAEKVLEKLGSAKHGETLEGPIGDPAAFEDARVSGAIRTDLILSGEIMAITLSEVAAQDLLIRAGVLALVGVLITFAVYGAVALIVKMDDVGLHLAEHRHTRLERRLGRILLHTMPRLLAVLSVVGTIAMLWVGGGIILHGIDALGWAVPYELVHAAQHGVAQAAGMLGPVAGPVVGGVLGWTAYAGLSALAGLALGAVIIAVLHKLLKRGAH